MSTIYIHWPYCLSKCYYCDFNSVVCKSSINYLEYYKLYKNVLNKLREQFYYNDTITSIYFGGGTPSLADNIFIDNVLNYIYKTFKVSNDIEITIEANPKTIDKYKASQFKSSGVNRTSIGVQSIIDEDLKILGRIHSAYDAIKCVYEISDVFDNVSIDVIYNRPGQKLENWANELNRILQLPIQHISMYELIIEKNTYIKYLIDQGFVDAPSNNSRFIEQTIKIAKSNDFEMYEISNYVKNGTQLYSKHNLSYWNYDRYYGIGPGAHSRLSIGNNLYAIEQICDITKWLAWANSPEFELNNSDNIIELLTQDDIYKEQLIMGLRTKFGVNINNLNKDMINKYKLFDKIEVLKENSYVLDNSSSVVLSYNGMLKLNMIVEYLTKN